MKLPGDAPSRLEWIRRNRRRAEMIALGVFVLLLLIAFGVWRSISPRGTGAPVVYRTVSTDAFKLNVGYANRPFVERFGTVALGVECRPSGSGSTNASTIEMLLGIDGKQYRVIDRNKVTPAAGVSKPLNTFGLCAPEDASESCPPLPPAETRTATCPSGYTGSWEQTRTYTAAPAPTCAIAGEWVPEQPPLDACVATPAGNVNLPVICTDASKEGQPISACAWSNQIFEIGYANALVRTCRTSPCTFETNVWARLGTIPTPGTVEVCGKLKQPPAPVSGGECGDATGTWSLMRYVPPPEVAGYAAPPEAQTARLNWSVPERTEVGAPIEDLLGYRIYYGQQSGVYPSMIDVADPTVTEHRFYTLPQGTWYFVIRAYSRHGGESKVSNEGSKTIP